MRKVPYNGVVVSAHELRPGCLVRITPTPELDPFLSEEQKREHQNLLSRTFMVDKRYLPRMGNNDKVYLRDLTDDIKYEDWYDPWRLTRLTY